MSPIKAYVCLKNISFILNISYVTISRKKKNNKFNIDARITEILWVNQSIQMIFLAIEFHGINKFFFLFTTKVTII